MQRRVGEECKKHITVALAGNPNVGKSTLFNSLTGMRVHTGNWSGKTVGCESARSERIGMSFVDIPGTYSLISHSEEERIARNYICFGDADVIVAVCDSTSLMQNLALVLQITETGKRTVLCLNFADEAKSRGIEIDVSALSDLLGIPVVSTVAHNRRSLGNLIDTIREVANKAETQTLFSVRYPESVEEQIKQLIPIFLKLGIPSQLVRWTALRAIEGDTEICSELAKKLSEENGEKLVKLAEAQYDSDAADRIAASIVGEAERIASRTVKESSGENRDRRIDKILTGRVSAYPLMLLLLFSVLFITVSLASYPSELLSVLFSRMENILGEALLSVGCPSFLYGILIEGAFRTLGQVISVMLVPMVIFFPLFSLLEDSGYLPRIAYNLDRPFACAGACGKQALTMCMGLGCNAVGIVGCRIIDSKRERDLAIITNSLVPCNGRFPMLITLISVFCLFFMSEVSGPLVALILSFMIILSVAATFAATAFLSRTLFKGERSSFTIELPPYRRPRFFYVLVGALRDKCASVLLRACAVALPMGLIIWIMANIQPGGASLISYAASALDPIGELMGLDGCILLAFILGIPANEIVVPIMIMIYSSSGAIGAELGIEGIREILYNVGWTPITAVCAAVFALFHWPCSTSLITVYKESKSLKITFAAFFVPTLIGFILCVLIRTVCMLFI